MDGKTWLVLSSGQILRPTRSTRMNSTAVLFGFSGFEICQVLIARLFSQQCFRALIDVLSYA